MRLKILGVVPVLALCAAVSAAGTDYKFAFGTGAPPAGFTAVSTETMYGAEKGYGFEATTNLPTPGQGARPVVAPALTAFGKGVASDKAFIFSAAVVPGNYRVTVVLGDEGADSTVTVKAEARRLMVEHLKVPKGTAVTRTFLVNVRVPEIPEHEMLTPRFVTPGETGPMPARVPASIVKLDPREPGSFTWDEKLSLQFCDAHAAVQQIEIHKVEDVTTVYLCSDSTVVDQPLEPYGSWGQMLPRWFDDKVCVANYAESGQTLKAFMIEKRWDKVMSLVKKGDYVFMQFGNNDSQTSGHNAMWPADDRSEDWNVVHSPADTDYQTILKDWAGQVKAKGAVPVIVASYARQTGGVPDPNIATPPRGLRGYPAAAEKAAKDSGTAFLNLTALSTEALTIMGPQNAQRAYLDGQHTSSYGAYMNSRYVAYGIKSLGLGLEKYLIEEALAFDLRKPLPLFADFAVPLEPGSGGGRGPGRGARGGATAPASAPGTRGN